MLTLLILGRPILSLLFGDKFLSAYVPMVFLIIGQFVSSISGSTGTFMNMTDNHKAFRNLTFFIAILNIRLNLFLIPRFGVNGAAFTGMISLSLWNILPLLFMKTTFGNSTGYLPIIHLLNDFKLKLRG